MDYVHLAGLTLLLYVRFICKIECSLDKVLLGLQLLLGKRRMLGIGLEGNKDFPELLVNMLRYLGDIVYIKKIFSVCPLFTHYRLTSCMSSTR